MSGHSVKLSAEGGLGIVVHLIHAGSCDQSANHDGECVLEDWVENCQEDLLQGEITIPVGVEWLAEDNPVLHLQPQVREKQLEEALEEAHHAIKETAKVLIAVRPALEKPYPDDPRWSPWTRFLDRSERSPWTLLVKADTAIRTALEGKETS